MALFGLNYYVVRKHLYPLKYKEEITYYADYYGHDRALIFAVVKTESGFDDKVVSKAGAVGLMQIKEQTAEYIAKKLGAERYDLTNATDNINFGCFYLKYLLLRFENIDTALIAYNAGEGNVSAWLSNPKYSEDKKTLKHIPFNESKEYIKKIHKNLEKYKKLYRNILDKR